MQEQKTRPIYWQLDSTEAQYIINKLSEQPYQQVANLLDKLIRQSNAPKLASIDNTSKEEPPEAGEA